KDIRKAESAEDPGHIPNDFVMLRRELKNAIITADMLDALRKVATNAEWSALRRLEVVTAAAYLTKDKHESMEEGCETILREGEGWSKNPLKPGAWEDKRSRAWYGVPLEQFVGKMVDKRKEYKANAKDPNEPDRKVYAGLDATLKLITNTLYGCFAS